MGNVGVRVVFGKVTFIISVIWGCLFMSLRKGHTVVLLRDQIKILVECLGVFEGNLLDGTYFVYETVDSFGLKCLSNSTYETSKRFFVEIDKETLEYKRGRHECYMFLRYFLLKLSDVRGISINSVKFEVPLDSNEKGKAVYDGAGNFDIELVDRRGF